MSKIRDLSVKKCISHPKIFCDLYNGGIFEGRQLLHPQYLQSLPSESYDVFNDKNGKQKGVQRYRDVIYSATVDGKFMILPVENQYEIHYGMVIRNMLYDALTYTEQLEKLRNKHREKRDLKTNREYLSGMRKDEKMKPIIPIVFYYGEEPWDASMDLHSILKIPEEIEKYKKHIPNYHINVVHVGNVCPEHFKTGLREVFELLRYAKDKDKLTDYFEQHYNRFSNMDNETSDMILLFLGGNEFMGINKEKYKDRVGGYNMCTAFREMREEGRILGFEQGLQQGLQQELKNIVKKLMEKGKTIEEISDLLDIDIDLISKM